MDYKITDSHVHSIFSEDSSVEIKEIIRKAIEKDVDIITFTEHVDFNPLDEGYKYLTPDKFIEAVKKANEIHQDQIEILAGVEFSEPHLYPKQLKKYNDFDLDLIIGAIHWIGDHFVGDEKLLDIYSKDEIFLRYYNMVYQMVKKGEIDVLAHLDFPKRYLNYEYKNFNLISQIIRMMIDNDVVLEINTSTLRKGFEEPMPSFWLLSKYKEMGGKKVTIGSDAHRLNEVATNFDTVYNIINELNLTLGYFKNRKFIAIK